MARGRAVKNVRRRRGRGGHSGLPTVRAFEGGYTFYDLLSVLVLGHTIAVKVENDNRFHLTSEAATKRLSEMPLNRPCRIERLEGPRQDCDRLLDLGFTPGEDVIITHAAPLGDPLVIRVRGTLLALRKREAAWIFVQ